jgi:RNA polymerase sigma-70 factor (family 1)
MLTTTIFDTLFRQYYRRLLAFALQYVEDEQDCHDIVSASFEQLWNMRDRIDPNTAKQYLYTSVRNGCIDYIRYQGHKKEYVEYCQKLSDVTDDTNKFAEQEEREKLVVEALGKLEEGTRAVVERCYIRGMKYTEVAEDLGITTNAVRKRMIKALKILRHKDVDDDS